MAESDPITKKDLEDALAQIKVLVREVQDVLLTHFRAQIKVHDMRLQGAEASDAALVQRLHVLEERVLNLEMRPTIGPH
jgi:hypothetical protein